MEEPVSADTEEQREADERYAIDSITRALIEHGHEYYSLNQVAAAVLAEKVYLAVPERCDYDCDSCRE